MPLNPSAGVSNNIREFHTGKTYARTAAAHGKKTADKQAIAVAYSVARRGRADGGQVDPLASAMMGGPSGIMPQTNPAVSPVMPNGVAQNAPAMPAGAMNVLQAGVASPVNDPMQRPLMNTGGSLHRAQGGINMAHGPHSFGGWQERAEDRGLMKGPILSAVPGRTDSHLTKVASGSYILPAAHIASMGQGNSVAGLATAHAMFGPGGPYGSSGGKISHGAGLPKPPHLAKFSKGGYSDGGARGNEDHIEVPVALAGGEYIIGPSVVRAIGKGSLKNGHSLLDAYVMAARKREIKTLRKLPPPAKK